MNINLSQNDINDNTVEQYTQQGEHDQINDKHDQLGTTQGKQRQKVTKNLSQNPLEQQIKILEDLIFHDKKQKILYKMRPSKVISQKCYRIVDLRQQRIKVLSNTKENEQFTNINLTKSQRSHNKSQSSNITKSPINGSQTSYLNFKQGSSKSTLNTHFSNITPNMTTSQMSNSNIYTEFDGKYFQPSVFQFNTNNLYFNDNGTQSSRSQFIFSEKYQKNLQSKKLLASRDKNRAQSKRSLSRTQKNFNSQQLQEQNSQQLNKNSDQNSKLNECQVNNGIQDNDISNLQFAFDNLSSKFNLKETKHLREDTNSKRNINKSNSQNVNEEFQQQQSAFIDTNQQQQFQSINLQLNKQSSSSCTTRNFKQQVNSKTSQGFYNIYTQNDIHENKQNNIQKLNSFPYQKEALEKQQKQQSFTFNLNNLDNTKSIIFKHQSNNAKDQKNTQSSLAQDFLASTRKKKPFQVVFIKDEAQINSNINQVEIRQNQCNTNQFNEQEEFNSQQSQNKSFFIKGSTSEDNRKHRKVSSNTVPLNSQQKSYLNSQKNLDQFQKQNNMLIFNLSSRPSTANNLLIKNKIFRDESLNSNLQRKQLQKQNQKVFNSSLGIYLDLEDFKQKNTDQTKQDEHFQNFKSMILQNTQQTLDQSKDQTNSQMNIKEDSQIDTIKSNSVIIKSMNSRSTPSNVFPSKSELFNKQNSQINDLKLQSEEAKKKQIDMFIGKIFKNSFFPEKNNLLNKINIFPKKASLNCLNSTYKNSIKEDNLAKLSKTQRFDINRKILQSHTKKQVQKTEESSYDYLETQQSQIQNYLESYDNIQQQQDSNQYQGPSEKQSNKAEDQKEKEIVNQENPDDKYLLLNQYFHQKYTQPINYNTKKQAILNQISKTQQYLNNDRLLQSSNRNNTQRDLEFYDKFEPWENDDQANNNNIDEDQE